jgi:hypothetical protein
MAESGGGIIVSQDLPRGTEVLRTTMRTLSQDSRCNSRHSNEHFPENKNIQLPLSQSTQYDNCVIQTEAMSSVLGSEFNTLMILNPMRVEQFDICTEFYIKWYT